MPQLGQAQSGKLRSTPKQLNVKASDKYALMFKNYGNNHNAPFIWSSTATVASGVSEVTVVSGIKFYDMDLATYGNFVATPTSDPGDDFWISQDTETNEVKIVVGTSVSDDVTFNVQVMLGADVDISAYSTRGTGAPQQSYP
jgi:hypothetical protein